MRTWEDQWLIEHIERLFDRSFTLERTAETGLGVSRHDPDLKITALACRLIPS